MGLKNEVGDIEIGYSGNNSGGRGKNSTNKMTKKNILRKGPQKRPHIKNMLRQHRPKTGVRANDEQWS